MTTFVLRRVLLMVPTLLVIATLTFVLMRLAPGGPFMSEKDIPAKVASIEYDPNRSARIALLKSLLRLQVATRARTRV